MDICEDKLEMSTSKSFSPTNFPPFLRPSLRARHKAFTLVEVVVAIGVVVFGLIAIFGLMNLSLKNSREANLRQGLTLVIDQVNSYYQSQAFTNALNEVPATNFFDNVGEPLANSSGAFFAAQINNVTPPNGQINASGLPPVDTNYLGILQLKIAWPYPADTSTNISVFSVLNTSTNFTGN